MKIKSLVVLAVLATAIFGFTNVAKASCMDANFSQRTNAEQVQCLTAIIADLQAQIQTILAQQGTPQAWCHTFNTNLGVGSVGTEAQALYSALSYSALSYSALSYSALSYSGINVGMLDGGKDSSNYFTEGTASLVIQFQAKYGITPRSGYIGPLTRAKLNLLYGCGVIPTQPSINISWSNGTNKVQIGLVNNNFENSKIVLGWILLNGSTGGSFTWNGGSLTDLAGNVIPWPSSPSSSFRILGVSASSAGNFCYGSSVDCNYVLSNSFILSGSQNIVLSPFSLTSTQPSNTIISPNGGEQWQVGQQVKIRWQTTGLDQNISTLLAIMDDRIPNWQALSLFGSSPVLNYATLVSSVGGVNTYEYNFIVPENFNSSLPQQYQNIYYGNHYKIQVIVLTGGVGGTLSQQTLTDWSDNYFTIVSGNDGQYYPTETLFTPQVSGYTVSQNGVTYPTVGQLDFTWCKIINPSASGTGPFEFNWGDGSISCSWFPGTHTYSTAGTYHVTVRVADTTGRISSRDNYVTISSVTIQPTITPSSAVVNSGSQTTFSWNIPNTIGAIAAAINIVCPSGVSVTTSGSLSNLCNSNYGILSTAFANTMQSFVFTNSGSSSSTVTLQITTGNVTGTSNQSNISTITVQPATSSITVTSPNGGEQWAIGSTHNITWTSSSVNNVMIKLTKNNPSAYWYITSSIPSSQGSFSWTVPSSISEIISPASDYKIKISDVINTSITDDSNNYFSIVAPPTTLINGVCGSANGVATATAPITNLCSTGTASFVSGIGYWMWTCTGLNGGTNTNCSATMTETITSLGTDHVLPGDRVAVYVSNFIVDSSYQYYVSISSSNTVTNILADLSADGTYLSFTVPNLGAGTYLIKAGALRIFLTNPLPITIGSAQSSIIITSPNGGEILTQGHPYTITWTGTNLSQVSAYLIPANSFGSVNDSLGFLGLLYSGNTIGWNANFSPGNYKIYLVGNIPNTVGQTVSSTSANYFSIAAP